MFDNVILLKSRAFNAFSAPALRAIEIGFCALCVAAAGDCDYNILIWNEIFD